MMMMMMDCFCGIADLRKAFSLISSQDHCQRSSLWRISDTQGAGFEPLENMSSGLAEWSCAVVITTTPQPNERFDLIITVKITKNWWNKKNESLGVSLQRFFFFLFCINKIVFLRKTFPVMIIYLPYPCKFSKHLCFLFFGRIRVCDVLFPWQRWLKTKKSEIIKVIES